MKGQYGGSCNITACQRENSAYWFNHFNQMYYCEECANKLNNDEFNKRSALEQLGHDMCTLAVENNVKGSLEALCNNIIEDAGIRFTTYNQHYQSGRESRRARRKQERKKK